MADDDARSSSTALESTRTGLGRWLPAPVFSAIMRGRGQEEKDADALQPAEEEPSLVQPELYVTTRQFRAKKSLIGRLPRSAKDTLSTAGVCHFMCVYRSERGELWQFDFGPFGGDVHSRLLSDTNDATLVPQGSRDEAKGIEAVGDSSLINGGEGSRRWRKSLASSNSTPGHVREKLLEELPTEENLLYVGRTSMTLDEVRAFNAARKTTYNVNENDCRHYVNALCRRATGVESACSKYVQGAVWGRNMLEAADDVDSGTDTYGSMKPLAATATFEQRQRRKHELAILLPLSMLFDLENAPLWDKVGQASSAALVIGIGVRAIPPALIAMAASRAAAGAGAGQVAARQTAAGMGAAAAGLGAAAEAGGLLVRAAAVTQPLVAPTARRLITTAAGVAGAAREDIADNLEREWHRAARLLHSLRSRATGKSAVRTSQMAAAPVVGWAGRRMTSQHASSAAGTSR